MQQILVLTDRGGGYICAVDNWEHFYHFCHNLHDFLVAILLRHSGVDVVNGLFEIAKESSLI